MRFLANTTGNYFILAMALAFVLATQVNAAEVMIFDSNNKEAQPELPNKTNAPKSVSKAPVVIGAMKKAKEATPKDKEPTAKPANEEVKEKNAAPAATDADANADSDLYDEE